MTSTLFLIVLSTAIGSGFQFGYNVGIINPAAEIIKEWISDIETERYNTKPSTDRIEFLWSIIVVLHVVGSLFGGLLNQSFARIGRKLGLLYNNLFALFGIFFEMVGYYVNSYECIMVGRFLLGVNAGIGMGLSVIYLQETAPRKKRGLFSAIVRVMFVFSQLFGGILGMETILGVKLLWPYLFLTAIAFILIQVPALIFSEETPKYLLITKNDERKARKSLEWLRRTKDIEDEFQELKKEQNDSQNASAVTLTNLFTDPVLKQQTMIGVLLTISQQFSGIASFMHYSTFIIQEAGFGQFESQITTITLLVINLAVTIISVFLIDKVGRKKLLLSGIIIMATTTAMVALSFSLQPIYEWTKYLGIVSIGIFIIGFALGPGAIPLIIISEMAPQEYRSHAVGIGMVTTSLSRVVVSLSFMKLKSLLGPFVFLLYTASLTVSGILASIYVPETKGKRVDEIQEIFRQRAHIPPSQI
ncbi:solute carrier family 2, facilitated glucose transporter member 1-like [Artemia franciscana]|uniref:solute carrier family 2, facilitated glucose transporter member 1-like n=1 Tax=Artemia franciscana TaxID=6661 RepID=UPI0032DBF2E7